MTLDRDGVETDALLTDLYLDALLAGAVLEAAVPTVVGAAVGTLDPAARRAADRLRHDLVRVHPSFRFEERLATRLAEAAVGLRMDVAAGAEGRVVKLRPATPAGDEPLLVPGDADRGPADPITASASLDRPAGDVDPGRHGASRPLLIGGALTSAALSLAGAAFVAWRLGRPGRAQTPMARAARAVREARLAAPAGPSLLGGGGGATRRRPD
jgi:hypothetical protein